MSDQLSKMLAERNAALVTLDMDYARRMLPTASSDEVRLLAMHKARYECTDIPAEFRHTSGHWLRERGSTRMDGTELLPEGELPLPANALGEGRERGILREASSGEAATSTDGLGVAVPVAPTFDKGDKT